MASFDAALGDVSETSRGASRGENSTLVPSLSSTVRERTIWAYWAQGAELMPAMFRMCVDTWKHHNLNWDIKVLDRVSVYDYVSKTDLPNKFDVLLSPQTASDCVRLALLARHGGVWLDVTILLRESLDDICWTDLQSNKISAAAFFHPHYGTTRFEGEDFVESWFLATRARNPFFLQWRDNMKELLHDRLDVNGVLHHPLYNGLDLSGFDRLNAEFKAGFDFREYLAIHAMCHRILESDGALQDQWRKSWLRINAAETAFRLQLHAQRVGGDEHMPVLMMFLSGGDEWDEEARRTPLIKFTTPHYRALVSLPAEVLLDDRAVISRLFRDNGVKKEGLPTCERLGPIVARCPPSDQSEG
eukprot:TRINITY_DN37034_c0_g1_i1.p1 TRINITY_DN37034_c0_g1~~TRINITY_DN37034_c0_g1_i1.p1  ORF type:complete len:359 (+),score=64.50 TRINITY_DN37034_c0_g1_i1:116-1192(+)